MIDSQMAYGFFLKYAVEYRILQVIDGLFRNNENEIHVNEYIKMCNLALALTNNSINN